MEPCDALVADDQVAGDLHLLVDNSRVASDLSQVTFTYFSIMHEVLLVQKLLPTSRGYFGGKLGSKITPTSRGYFGGKLL